MHFTKNEKQLHEGDEVLVRARVIALNDPDSGTPVVLRTIDKGPDGYEASFCVHQSQIEDVLEADPVEVVATDGPAPHPGDAITGDLEGTVTDGQQEPAAPAEGDEPTAEIPALGSEDTGTHEVPAELQEPSGGPLNPEEI